jgi:hypothetical protein
MMRLIKAPATRRTAAIALCAGGLSLFWTAAATQVGPPDRGSGPRLSAHGFPKLFIQLQGYAPGGGRVGEASYRDLLVLDAELVASHPGYFGPKGLVRSFNKNAVIVVYFSAADVIPGNTAPVNAGFIAGVKDAWYLKDTAGARFKLFELPGGVWTEMLNQTTAVNAFLPNYLKKKVMSAGLADGIFFDWVTDDISWLNYRTAAPGGPPDIDNDGQADSDAKLNARWVAGMKTMLRKARAAFPAGSLIIGNSGGVTEASYGHVVDGLMIENFTGAEWAFMMRKHWTHLRTGRRHNLSLIMANGSAKDFKTMRYVLCSTLMFNGYFTYTNTGCYLATWWFDEYGVDPASGRAAKSLSGRRYLGLPAGDAFNVAKPAEKLKTILSSDDYADAATEVWRRDFKNGIVLVNPSRSSVTVELGGTFRKIKGTVDQAFNDGRRLSRLSLPSRSGAVLLKLPNASLFSPRERIK